MDCGNSVFFSLIAQPFLYRSIKALNSFALILSAREFFAIINFLLIFLSLFSQLLPDQMSLLNKTKPHLHHTLKNVQSTYKTVLVRIL